MTSEKRPERNKEKDNAECAEERGDHWSEPEKRRRAAAVQKRPLQKAAATKTGNGKNGKRQERGTAMTGNGDGRLGGVFGGDWSGGGDVDGSWLGD